MKYDKWVITSEIRYPPHLYYVANINYQVNYINGMC